MYDIAEFIPYDACVVACKQRYNYPNIFRKTNNVRTGDGYCPLGIALKSLKNGKHKNNHKKWYNPTTWISKDTEDYFPKAPHSATFATEMHRNNSISNLEIDECRRAASEFIEDWDSGIITDLREALGVKN